MPHLLSDLCSMKVRMGTFQTGPRRKLTRESNTQASSASASLFEDEAEAEAEAEAGGAFFLVDILVD